MRNIHWAQTVRSQRLMVRERQRPTSASAKILVDLTPCHHEGRGIHSSFEWAIRVAGSISFQMHQAKAPVRVICLGLPSHSQRSADNRHGVHTILNFLAQLPTFEQSLETAASGTKKLADHDPPSHFGRTFFVGTNRSTDLPNVSKNVESVLIDLQGFKNGAGDGPNVEDPIEMAPRILITAPQLAASQLETEWKRSFTGAAG